MQGMLLNLVYLFRCFIFHFYYQSSLLDMILDKISFKFIYKTNYT